MKFPMLFTVKTVVEQGIQTKWGCEKKGLSPIPCSIPHEFGGPGSGYSPEDLFLFSIVSCMLATFKVYCEKSHLQFGKVSCEAAGSLNKDPASPGGLWIESISIAFTVTGASNVEKVKAALGKAVADCVISRSIKSTKEVHITMMT